MRPVQPVPRRRSTSGWLVVGAVLFVVTALGAVGAVAVLGVPAKWRWWEIRGPVISIPVNVKPIAPYTAVTREDLIDFHKRTFATIDLPLPQVVGASLEFVDETGESRRSAVRAIASREGKLEFTMRDGTVVPLERVRELGGALLQANDIIGRVVKSEKRPGYGFKEDSFLPKGTRPGVAGGVPDGMQAISLPADRLQGVHVLRAGDRVDLLATIPTENLPRFGGSDASRLPGAELVTSSTPPRDKSRRGELRLLAEDAMLVTPVTVRGAPLKTASLTQGAQVRTVPVQEVVLAVKRDDVPGLTEALNSDVDFTCVVHSGRPAPKDLPTDADQGRVSALVAARPIQPLDPLDLSDLVDPRTRRQPRVMLTTDEFERRRAFTDPAMLVGRVARHSLVASQLITEDDLLPAGTPGGVAAGVPVGMRAMVVDANRLAGLVALAVGDRFDVLGATPVDWGRDGGRQPRILSTQGRPAPLGALGPQADVRVFAHDLRMVARLPAPPENSARPAATVQVVVAVADHDVAPLAEAIATDVSLSVVARSARADAADAPPLPAPRSSQADVKVLETMIGDKRDSVIFVPTRKGAR